MADLIVVAGLALGLAACASQPAGDLYATEVEVTLSCRVLNDGAVDDCRVERERPQGYGMGPQALAQGRLGRVTGIGNQRARVAGGRAQFDMRLPIGPEDAARARRARLQGAAPQS